MTELRFTKRYVSRENPGAPVLTEDTQAEIAIMLQDLQRHMLETMYCAMTGEPVRVEKVVKGERVDEDEHPPPSRTSQERLREAFDRLGSDPLDKIEEALMEEISRALLEEQRRLDVELLEGDPREGISKKPLDL